MTDSLVQLAETAIGRPTATARRLVNASVSNNTRRAYAGALGQLGAWLDGRRLDDAALAAYLAELHDAGRASSIAAMAIIAVRFSARLAVMDAQNVPQVAKSAEHGSKEGRGPALKAPGRAHADHLTQQQPEVAAGDMHEQPFQDVGMSSKMDPSHPACLAHVGKRPLQQFSSTPQQATAPHAANPAPVGMHCVAGRWLAFQHRRPRFGSEM